MIYIQIILIVLKLFKLISWSWPIVFLPAIIYIIIHAFIFLYIIIEGWFNENNNN